jgi:hypothetical protein
VTVTPRHGWVAVQHLWIGPDRDFACWYLNIQEPMRPTEIGFDSQDLELDIVVAPDRTWALKDDDLLDQRVAEGRWTPEEAAAIRAIAREQIDDVLEPHRWWWDERWAAWEPDPSLPVPTLRPDWASVNPPAFAGILA